MVANFKIICHGSTPMSRFVKLFDVYHGELMDLTTISDLFSAMAKKGYTIFHKETIFTERKQGDRNID